MAGRVKQELRVDTRVPIRILVEYEDLDDFLSDYSSNVSLGGMFVSTDEPLDIGTRFRLRFRIPERPKAVETYGEVRWVNAPGDPLNSGMGIAFDELTPMDKRAVEEWLRASEANEPKS